MAKNFKKEIEYVCQFLVDIYFDESNGNNLHKNVNVPENDKIEIKLDKIKKDCCNKAKQLDFKSWKRLFYSIIYGSEDLKEIMLNRGKGLFHQYFDVVRDTWSNLEEIDFCSVCKKVKQTYKEPDDKVISKIATKEILEKLLLYRMKIDLYIESLEIALQSKNFNNIDQDIPTAQDDCCIDFYLHLLGFYNNEYSYNELDQSKFVGWIVSNKTILNGDLGDEDLSKFPLSNSSSGDYATWQFYHSFFTIECETEKQLVRSLIKDLLCTQTGKMLIYSSLLNRARIDSVNQGKSKLVNQLIDNILDSKTENISCENLTEPNPMHKNFKQLSVAFVSSKGSDFSPKTQRINISLENNCPILTKSELLTSLVHELVHSLQVSGHNANLLTTIENSIYFDFLNFSYTKDLVDMYLGDKFRLEHCYDVVNSDYSLMVNCLNNLFNLDHIPLKTSELHQLYNEFLLYMSDSYSSFGSVVEFIAVNGYFGKNQKILGKLLCENLFRYEIGNPIRNSHLPDLQSRYNNDYWSDKKADWYEDALYNFFEKCFKSISGMSTTQKDKAYSHFKAYDEKPIELSKSGELKATAYGHKYHINFNKLYEREDLAKLDQFKILRIHSLIDKKCPNTKTYHMSVLLDILKQVHLESFLIVELANSQEKFDKLDVVKFFHAKSVKNSPFYELAKKIVDNNKLTKENIATGVEILKNYVKTMEVK